MVLSNISKYATRDPPTGTTAELHAVANSVEDRELTFHDATKKQL
jgi:hypothetical protein